MTEPVAGTQGQEPPQQAPALPLVIFRAAVGIALLAAGFWAADYMVRVWIPLTSEFADQHPELVQSARLRVPDLPSEGDDDAPLVIVLAWDPSRFASTELLRRLHAYVQHPPSAERLGDLASVRVVRLIAPPPEFDGATLDLLGALDHRDRLQPWLLEAALPGDVTPARLRSALGDSDRDRRLLDRDTGDPEVRSWVRTQGRIAQGLGLAPGDIAIHGRRVPGQTVATQAGLEQVLSAALAELEQAAGKAQGDRARIQAVLTADRGDDEDVVRMRYRRWILRGEKISTADGAGK